MRYSLIQILSFLIYRFKKFDDKYLRKLLIRENQPKSSIVSLYKKLEIKHAIEMAETGMISTVPSFASLK